MTRKRFQLASEEDEGAWAGVSRTEACSNACTARRRAPEGWQPCRGPPEGKRPPAPPPLSTPTWHPTEARGEVFPGRRGDRHADADAGMLSRGQTAPRQARSRRGTAPVGERRGQRVGPLFQREGDAVSSADNIHIRDAAHSGATDLRGHCGVGLVKIEGKGRGGVEVGGKAGDD